MSENDSDSGTGRKGFVRDVMRRISPAGQRPGEEGEPHATGDRIHRSDIEHLQDAMRFFGSDSTEFRSRLDRVLADFETLRRRYDVADTDHVRVDSASRSILAAQIKSLSDNPLMACVV